MQVPRYRKRELPLDNGLLLAKHKISSQFVAQQVTKLQLFRIRVIGYVTLDLFDLHIVVETAPCSEKSNIKAGHFPTFNSRLFSLEMFRLK